jgi:hypothetical protein
MIKRPMCPYDPNEGLMFRYILVPKFNETKSVGEKNKIYLKKIVRVLSFGPLGTMHHFLSYSSLGSMHQILSNSTLGNMHQFLSSAQ